jgi:hypothetical protein
MDATDIKARIEKTEDAIAKKNALIDKRFKAIGKCIEGMKKSIANLGGHIDFEFSEDIERIDEQNSVAEKYIQSKGIVNGNWNNAWYDILWDYHYKISDYTESIKNARRDIKDKEVTLATYRERLAKAEEKEDALNNLPACMTEFMDSMIELWDAWDKMRRETIKDAQKEYYELCDEERKAVREHGRDSEEAKALRKEARYIVESYSNFEWNELYRLDDDEIHEKNVMAGKSLVIDLYNRVAEIVGKFENADNLKVTRGNKNIAVINGTVEGNGRIAKVQSIGAGGYNIQRFHIRTLVHEVH